MSMRLIHVGLGGWGLDWSRNTLSNSMDVEVVAWVEIDPEVLAQAQKKLDLPAEHCFTSLEHAFSAIEAEAVLITTSLPGHVPVAVAALNAGKHVLLEKPFAPVWQKHNTLLIWRHNANAFLWSARIIAISRHHRRQRHCYVTNSWERLAQ